MTEPVYTTATVATWNEEIEVFVPTFSMFRATNQEMLVNSIVHENTHPVYIRHWTSSDDAQAWANLISEFAAENNFNMQVEIVPI